MINEAETILKDRSKKFSGVHTAQVQKPPVTGEAVLAKMRTM